MRSLVPIEPIEYLVIGHITTDLTPAGPVTGGTAAYAALTARSLGLRVGVVTSAAEDTSLAVLDGIQVIHHLSEDTTTFENLNTPEGRRQILHHRADLLDLSHIPETWRSAPIVHLGPVAQEIDPRIVHAFPTAMLGITPQGWLREWDSNGQVRQTEWPEASFVLSHAGAVVLSNEDVSSDEKVIEEYTHNTSILAITEGAMGARLYWNGDVRTFRVPQTSVVDATGAGDIFAACFFVRYSQTRDPWEAARFANQLAAKSVTRQGLDGVPTPEECRQQLIEVLP